MIIVNNLIRYSWYFTLFFLIYS